MEELIMTPKKKRNVNHRLRQIQLELHGMNDDGLLLFSQVQKLTAQLQDHKYPLEELS